MEYSPYNPLDKINLGSSVADALLNSCVHKLGFLEPFNGAGIYAIYYSGNFKAYELLAKENSNGKFSMPIYVGKAISPGARKGNFGLNNLPGHAMFNRLKEHADSVDAAENLNLNDFYCRFLVVEDIWIPLGEALLIAKFSPILNKLIEGFGNHDLVSGRYKQIRSKWDTLHPGRSWAFKCTSRTDNLKQITLEINNYLIHIL
ncbi:MAG: Eco29kI family restriction endonuclease [Deltaproteobacteria bacterium]|jgi:hypothetical protein|nr:Eco29kI family restriction endonuclease [Deltaproteobacteria bacterium]